MAGGTGETHGASSLARKYFKPRIHGTMDQAEPARPGEGPLIDIWSSFRRRIVIFAVHTWLFLNSRAAALGSEVL